MKRTTRQLQLMRNLALLIVDNGPVRVLLAQVGGSMAELLKVLGHSQRIGKFSLQPIVWYLLGDLRANRHYSDPSDGTKYMRMLLPRGSAGHFPMCCESS